MNSVDLVVSDITEQKKTSAELPSDVQVYLFIERLARGLGLPLKGPDDIPIKYQILHKESHTQILDLQTLAQHGVKNGDALLLIPEITAGAVERR